MTEIEKLRREVAELREEVTRLKAAPHHETHYHHHGPAPSLLPQYPTPQPYYPGGPMPVTCDPLGLPPGNGTCFGYARPTW